MDIDREQLIIEYMRECGLSRELAEEVADEHIQIHNENEALFASKRKKKKLVKITTDKEFVAKPGSALPKRSPHYRIKLFKLNKLAYQRWKQRPKLYPYNFETLFRSRFDTDNYQVWQKIADFPKGHGTAKDKYWFTWEVFDWIAKHNHDTIKNVRLENVNEKHTG